MAFLKFSRDKRGVENFFLVHQTTNRRGKVRPRVLYWFRSPPDIKVGRQPFDSHVRRALEAQNPDVTFDWRAIAETPIPSADADKWRERRRAERAAKYAAAAEEAADAVTVPADADAAGADAAGADDAPAEQTVIAVAAAATSSPPASTARDAPRSSDPNRKRRRRRRGGSGRGGVTPSGSAPAPPVSGEPSED